MFLAQIDPIVQRAIEHPFSLWAIVVFTIGVFLLGFYGRGIAMTAKEACKLSEECKAQIATIQGYINSNELLIRESIGRIDVIENYIECHEKEANDRNGKLNRFGELLARMEEREKSLLYLQQMRASAE